MISSIVNTFRRIGACRQSKTQRIKFFYRTIHVTKKDIVFSAQYKCVTNENDYDTFHKTFSYTGENYTPGRFERGSLFCALIDDCHCVSSGWIAFQEKFWISEIDVVIDMDQSMTGILYDFYTAPEYRGKGWYGLLLNTIISKIDGPHEYIIYIKKENISSEKGILKADFQYEIECQSDDVELKTYLHSKGFSVIGSQYRFGGLFYKKSLQ